MDTARKPAYRQGRRISLSLLTALSLWGVLAFVLLKAPPKNILSWDTFGYHLYLPATLIHHDPGLHDPTWVKDAVATYNSSGSLYQISKLPDDDRWVMKYPVGLAMLWSPFFVGGHIVAGITGAPQDGFSPPYQWALMICALVYTLAGLLVLRKLLRAFFTEVITAATLALIIAGTNYFHQAIYSTGMPHVFLFTLGAGVLWHSMQWYRSQRRRDALITGALLGLLVASRPSEIVWVFIPLFIGLAGISSWRQHLRTLYSRRKHLLLMAFAATLMCLPQLIYWKWMTGHWLYMSYNNPGEGFEFLHPHTLEALFSFRKGWYIYTPLMLVATLGIFLVRRYAVEMRWSVIVFFVINLYVVSSWSCWWYADSFSQRALVQSYPLMALLLGAVLCWLKEQRTRWMIHGAAVLLLLVGLNLFQTHQSINGLIHTSRMTWPAYKAVFGTMAAPANFNELLSVERSYTGEEGSPDLSRYKRRKLVAMHFDTVADGSDAGVRDTSAFAGTGAYRLQSGREFSPSWRTAWEELTDCNHVWLEVSCRVQRPLNGSTPLLTLVTTFEHNGHSYAYATRDAKLDEVAPGEWQRLSMWYLSPEVRRPTDPVIIYCWLRDTLPVLVDEMEVVLYEPKVEP